MCIALEIEKRKVQRQIEKRKVQRRRSNRIASAGAHDTAHQTHRAAKNKRAVSQLAVLHLARSGRPVGRSTVIALLVESCSSCLEANNIMHATPRNEKRADIISRRRAGTSNGLGVVQHTQSTILDCS